MKIIKILISLLFLNLAHGHHKSTYDRKGGKDFGTPFGVEMHEILDVRIDSEFPKLHEKLYSLKLDFRKKNKTNTFSEKEERYIINYLDWHLPKDHILKKALHKGLAPCRHCGSRVTPHSFGAKANKAKSFMVGIYRHSPFCSFSIEKKLKKDLNANEKK